MNDLAEAREKVEALTTLGLDGLLVNKSAVLAILGEDLKCLRCGVVPSDETVISCFREEEEQIGGHRWIDERKGQRRVEVRRDYDSLSERAPERPHHGRRLYVDRRKP